MKHTISNRWMAGLLALTLGAGSLQAAEASEVAAFKSIVSRLDVGGNELEVINPTRFLKLLNNEITAAEVQILERMPDQKDQIEMMLTILRSSGLFEVQGYGASSIAIVDASPLPLYRGRNFLKIDLDNPGWVVKSLFPANRNLAEIPAQLPDTTLVAFDWVLDAQVAQAALAEPLADLNQDVQDRIARICATLTGRVEVVVYGYAADGAEATGWRVSLPDSGDGDMWNTSTQNVVLNADGRITIFSNQAARDAFDAKLAAGSVLADSPEFKATAVGLTEEEGVGFVYIRTLDVAWETLAAKCPGFDLDLFEAIRMNFDESGFVVASQVDDGILLQSNSHADSSASMAMAVGRYVVPAILAMGKSGMLEPTPPVSAAPSNPRTMELLQVSEGLRRYATSHDGAYPGDDVWKVLAEGGYIIPPLAHTGLAYFGPTQTPEAAMRVPMVIAMPMRPSMPMGPNMPACAPMGPNAPVGIIFADGHTEFLPMPAVDSLKGAVSMLHSMRPMPAAEFQRVVEKAAQLDQK